jgi:hypothetical protein
MIESLTAKDFEPHTGDNYRLVPADGAPVDVVLASVTAAGEAPADHRAPFSLEFRAPLTSTLGQGSYRVEHGSSEAIELFLVPIGPDADGMLYQAVFG